MQGPERLLWDWAVGRTVGWGVRSADEPHFLDSRPPPPSASVSAKAGSCLPSWTPPDWGAPLPLSPNCSLTKRLQVQGTACLSPGTPAAAPGPGEGPPPPQASPGLPPSLKASFLRGKLLAVREETWVQMLGLQTLAPGSPARHRVRATCSPGPASHG